MEKQGLIIGIDYTKEYCQACYYNHRHSQPESVTTGSSVMRYLVPTVLCYSEEKQDWAIGDEATRIAEQTGCYLFRDLLANTLDGEKVTINDKGYSYSQLLAVYLGKLLQLIQVNSGYTCIENITPQTGESGY